LNKEIEGALILDPEKVSEVSVKVAKILAPEREKLKLLPELDEVQKMGC
jgi:acetyl-CoA decarbonylase/synthase complex subunit alpha